MNLRVLLVFAAALALLTGCSAPKQKTNLEASGFMEDYTKLREGKSDEMGLVYRSGADFKKYDKVYLEPITVWRGAHARAAAGKDMVQLAADYLYTVIYARLARDYEMAEDISQPNTILVRLAFTNTAGSDTKMEVLSTQRAQPNLVQQFRARGTGTVPRTGESILEAEFRDGITTALLWAGVERSQETRDRYTWDDLEADLKFDAERIGYILCKERGDDCPMPMTPDNTATSAGK